MTRHSKGEFLWELSEVEVEVCELVLDFFFVGDDVVFEDELESESALVWFYFYSQEFFVLFRFEVLDISVYLYFENVL